MRTMLNALFSGLASIGEGWNNIIQSWNRPIRKRTFKFEKIKLTKITGYYRTDAEALRSDMDKIKKDWEKVLGKSQK